MIQTFEKIFATSSNAARKFVVRALMNIGIIGGSVRDH